jgi:hypothetical protein
MDISSALFGALIAVAVCVTIERVQSVKRSSQLERMVKGVWADDEPLHPVVAWDLGRPREEKSPVYGAYLDEAVPGSLIIGMYPSPAEAGLAARASARTIRLIADTLR